MLDAGVAGAGEDDHTRARDVLARPERGERACWRVLATFWTRVFWPMPWLGELGLGTVGFLELQRCSRTRRWVEREARERGAKGGRHGMVWCISPLFSTLNDQGKG